MPSRPSIENQRRSVHSALRAKLVLAAGALWLVGNLIPNLAGIRGEVASLLRSCRTAVSLGPDQRIRHDTGMNAKQLDGWRAALKKEGSVIALYAPRSDPKFDPYLARLCTARMHYLLYPVVRHVELLTDAEEIQALFERHDWRRLVVVDSSMGRTPSWVDFPPDEQAPARRARPSVLRKAGPIQTWILDRR